MQIQGVKQKFKHQLAHLHTVSEIQQITKQTIEYATGLTASEQIIQLNLQLNEKQELIIENALQRLLQEEPMQYIFSEAWFYTHPFYVNKHVLIPRPETEELVDWVLNHASILLKNKQTIRVVDLGTGSGCIPISIKKALGKQAQVWGFDVSELALDVANTNAHKLDADVCFQRLDMLQEWHVSIENEIDIIVSNPPYIKQSEQIEMKKNVLEYEPSLALFVSDSNPLIFYEAIAKKASKHLSSQGSIFVEINESLGYQTELLFQQHGFKTELKKDMFGKDRMLSAMLK